MYLEGKKALLPLIVDSPDAHSYFIGSKKTKLIIKDYRRDPNLAAQQVLSGNKELDFADVFNKPAWVEVHEVDDYLEIRLYEVLTQGDFPILWLGVNRDGKMPVHKLEWEILRPVRKSVTAFAALVLN